MSQAVQVTYANSWYVCYVGSQSAHIFTGLIKIQTFWEKKTFDPTKLFTKLGRHVYRFLVGLLLGLVYSNVKQNTCYATLKVICNYRLLKIQTIMVKFFIWV